MKKRKHIWLYIFTISSIFTYFIFHSARASAIAERGNLTAIGGEFLLLLLPLIAIIVYENIILSKQVIKRKPKENKIGKIQIVGIKNITEQEKYIWQLIPL